MKIMKKQDRPPHKVMTDGAVDVSVSKMVAESDGAPTAAMRLFEIEPGGHTPWHAHGWEHVIYAVEGRGALKTEHGNAEFGPGDALLVEPDEEHNFVNVGDTPLRFICVVPLSGDK
ncbi:MAG: cupin domain-containing protein [Candidatus Eisenbacteria bacterium]|nr:cupin domain-containing protein [Candidatus Eisenbacteria bacterium]